MTKDGIALRGVGAKILRAGGFTKSFLKQTEYIHSMLDVGRSMFDVD